MFLGLDLGTSGCRLCVVDGDENPLACYSHPWPPGCSADPEAWWAGTCALLERCVAEFPPARLRALAVDGTSTTLFLVDARGLPVGPVLPYHDARAQDQCPRIRNLAPPDAPVHGATASLPKALWLLRRPEAARARRLLHQADWIAGRLLGRFDLSDENNSLKMGYDPQRRRWPSWLGDLEDTLPQRLPRVLPPGTPLGPVAAPVARRLGLPRNLQVVAGTTDGVAAFLASGARYPGEAVTSLGSTLVLKVLAQRPVQAPAQGVYSHRLGDLWLAGGASNCGCAVLDQFFDRESLQRMTPRLQPDQPTGLDYYPLPRPGERFPIDDPRLEPRLSPRPEDPVRFFQAILEGLARVEALGYQVLESLDAPRPRCIYTVGGGAANRPWLQIRARLLPAPVMAARHQEAAYGSALLACRGFAGGMIGVLEADPAAAPETRDGPETNGRPLS